MATNLLEQYPKAKPTKLQGLFIIGKNKFVIQIKIDFHGTVCGYQSIYQGSFKEAVQAWKDARKQVYARAKAKWIAAMKERLADSNIKLFK